MVETPHQRAPLPEEALGAEGVRQHGHQGLATRLAHVASWPALWVLCANVTKYRRGELQLPCECKG